VTLVAFLAGYFICKDLSTGLYLTGAIKICIFATIYMGWTILFKPKPFCALKALVESRIKKKV
jgi:hypothetical protein